MIFRDKFAKVVQVVIVTGLIYIHFGFSGFGMGGTAEVLLADNGQASTFNSGRFRSIRAHT
jgi:amino acid permease